MAKATELTIAGNGDRTWKQHIEYDSTGKAIRYKGVSLYHESGAPKKQTRNPEGMIRKEYQMRNEGKWGPGNEHHYFNVTPERYQEMKNDKEYPITKDQFPESWFESSASKKNSLEIASTYRYSHDPQADHLGSIKPKINYSKPVDGNKVLQNMQKLKQALTLGKA